MGTRSFFIGAVTLTVAAGINKILGFVFQAAVYRLIGPEGIGLFNQVYPVYILILVITTAGIPLAVSKLTAQYYAQGNGKAIQKVLWLALAIVVTSSVSFTGLTTACFPLLVKYVFYDSRVAVCFASIIPGIMIVSVSSVFRGYFQGLHEMAPTAVAQVLEQITRIVSGLLLAYYFLPKGIALAAAGIAAGGILGELVGFLTILCTYRRRRYSQRYGAVGRAPRNRHVLNSFVELCGPITVGRVLSTLLISLDSFLIPRRLVLAGLTGHEATKVFGQFTGVALTLISIPNLITIALATTLVPAIADAEARQNTGLLNNRTGDSFRITILSSLPFCVFCFLFAPELTKFIFNAPEVTGLVRILCLGAPFLYLIQTTTGILQGLGEPLIPMRNLILGCLFKIAGVWFVTASSLAIQGTAIVFVFYFAVVCLLNIVSLRKFTVIRMKTKGFPLKLGIVTLLLSLYGYGIKALFMTKQFWHAGSLAISIGAGFVIYLVMLCLLGLVNDQDLNRVPFLRKLIG